VSANAEPTTIPSLTTISDEAMAMVKRAAIVLFVNILLSERQSILLRNVKVNSVHSILNILMEYTSLKKKRFNDF
jgi:hypothetical protein